MLLLLSYGPLCSVSVILLQHRAILFTCFSSGLVITAGRLLGRKMAQRHGLNSKAAVRFSVVFNWHRHKIPMSHKTILVEFKFVLFCVLKKKMLHVLLRCGHVSSQTLSADMHLNSF